MPIATIQMIEGRSEEVKREIIEKVTQALAEASNSPVEAIRIIIQEVPSTNWGKAGVMAKDEGR
ncbi:2-hydroxymuconate tautomerase [Oceanobacter antarcticus]|jgi:4-oxalocrotonate tautomerase|uniref:Tautomerase n=1 Tax=Oceanobacter antarcticus TaxID=3133425 RepID=A0ABW8NMD4_9GAMM|tara:strand:- start:14954 stop:15145 length:192 start_codon:yes stop_codon:yes gene_type:complete